MEWLDKHAGSVQALAAVGALLVTMALATLTGWYVRLTRSIASSALAQVEHLKLTTRTAQVQAARSLEALSVRIRVPLAQLSADSPAHAQLLEYNQLTNQEIADLEALARQVSEDAIRYAGKAVVSLRGILGLIEEAQSVNRATGWYANDNQTKTWKTAMEAGPRMLIELEKACRAVAAA